MNKDIEALKELDEISIGYETWLERKTLLQAVYRHCDVLVMYNDVEALKELKEIVDKGDAKILTDYAIKHNLIRSEE